MAHLTYYASSVPHLNNCCSQNSSSLQMKRLLKLRKIYEENKKNQTEIAALYQEMKKKHNENQTYVSKTIRQIYSFIQSKHQQFLHLLQTLKKRQLEAIQEDLDHNKIQSLKINQMMVEGNADLSLQHQINQIKPFALHQIKKKFLLFNFHQQKIQHNIQNLLSNFFKFSKQFFQNNLDSLETLHPEYDSAQDQCKAVYDRCLNKKQTIIEGNFCQSDRKTEKRKIIKKKNDLEDFNYDFEKQKINLKKHSLEKFSYSQLEKPILAKPNQKLWEVKNLSEKESGYERQDDQYFEHSNNLNQKIEHNSQYYSKQPSQIQKIIKKSSGDKKLNQFNQYSDLKRKIFISDSFLANKSIKNRPTAEDKMEYSQTTKQTKLRKATSQDCLINHQSIAKSTGLQKSFHNSKLKIEKPKWHDILKNQQANYNELKRKIYE